MSLTILVPVDGSPLAARALPFAARLVADGRGSLVLVHVRTDRANGQSSAYDPAADVAALRDAGVTAYSVVYKAPAEDVATVLSVAIHEAPADLVVMSTHGRGGLNRSVFGSVADALTRRADVPVLLIPPACETAWLDRQPAQLLVPLDGSSLAEQALEPAGWLARLMDAELLLVRVLSSMLHPRYRDGKLILSSGDFDEIDDAWRYLAKIADEVRADGCRASHWVLVGSPSASIAGAADAEGADLIAMTTHGRGGLGRILLGSVAEGVLQRAHVPLLLIRSGAAAAAVPIQSGEASMEDDATVAPEPDMPEPALARTS